MARQPFTIESAEVSSRWETLSKLLQQEQDQHMLDEIQQSVGHLPFATEVDGSPTPTIDCIKSNLGVERDFSPDIEAATEAYNISVCRTIGPTMYSTLPRELRDMIYEHLTTQELVFQPRQSRKLYVWLGNPKYYAVYFVLHPRSEHDRLCPERYWRDDVVSSKVAYELMESWYRNSTFEMDDFRRQDEDPDEFFKAVLDKDRFNKGLQPRKLITQFTRTFYLGHTDEGVLQCLDNMSLFGTATRLQVKLRLWHEVEAYKDFLAPIRPTILRLRVMGYRCTVSAINPWFLNYLDNVSKKWEQDLEAEIKNNNSMAPTVN